MVQIWHPIASSAGLAKVLYLPPNAAHYGEQFYSLPNGTLSDLDTGSYLNGLAIHPLLTK
jgi:hypothetical protein